MSIKIIIGLGNADPQYKNTYHNIGHTFVDYLADNNFSISAKKNGGFMNEAGGNVRQILKMQNIRPQEMLLVHDDSDIFIGDHKLQFGRGAAGHKGVQSVIDALGTKDFWRLRIGIRPKPRSEESKREKADKFVLKKITSVNKKILEGVFASAAIEIAAK